MERGTQPKRIRFEVSSDGTHEHFLKHIVQQGKQCKTLRDLLRRKKKGGPEADNDQAPSVTNWTDRWTRKHVQQTLDLKRGSTSTAGLVEKYGKCKETVGYGSSAIVRVSHKKDAIHETEQLYAVKIFRLKPQQSVEKCQERIASEFYISSSLQHPNIVHTLDLLRDKNDNYCEVMEFCAGGDLYTLILTASRLEDTEVDCYFKQLLRGVEYLHEMGVAHHDLKPENLLLTVHGCLKITDFGNAECFRMAWEKEVHMTCGLRGTRPYIAPEEYLEKEFDPRPVDVWATGVIYLTMRTGRLPWGRAKKDDEFFKTYLEHRSDDAGYRPIEKLPGDDRRNVVYSILDPKPSRRITASQVLNSEWCRKIQLCKSGDEGF